ncbi:nuclear transport factor 2 family protein [Flavobacteriaceae bacterium XHP0103]|uniref:YybH family protein n=1 Tax=Marixanthotalea marina TaxID=2844359 RepID=UPI002989D3D6|nr:nuclear transport factor 2 family protein [Marixanthotalea marina]MBU3822879.1 nuclear transport factor 2 family protein [Marixanthotalea marina]
MDKIFIEQFTKNWLKSWNTHNLEAILSHYAEDFEITSPLALERFPESQGTIKGKEAVGKYWALGLKLNPNLEFEIIDVLSGVNSISIYYLSKASQKHVVETLVFDETLKVCKAIVNYR